MTANAPTAHGWRPVAPWWIALTVITVLLLVAVSAAARLSVGLMALVVVAVAVLGTGLMWPSLGSRGPRPAWSVLPVLAGMAALAALTPAYPAAWPAAYAHVWRVLDDRRWAAAGCVGVAVASLASVPNVLGQPENLTFTLVGPLVTLVLALSIGLWVTDLQRTSAERARLIGVLESTRAELAEAERRRGAADAHARLARDIHDTLAQGYTSIIMMSEAARLSAERLPEDAARGRLVEQLDVMEEIARENLGAARRLINAQPDEAATRSLAESLRAVTQRFQQETGLEVELDLDARTDTVTDTDIRVAAVRCVQEALANVRRHAGASTAGVRLAHQGDELEVEVYDDGRGFDPQRVEGFGLRAMEERISLLGGRLTVTSAPEAGTLVQAVLPRRKVD